MFIDQLVTKQITDFSTFCLITLENITGVNKGCK